ncbi:uncharacterized protein Z520_09957 [Fonsecaea multimorphosa CBS 102226]|uniref:Response regulatory domain-containing protein n=1 Tax=Fonsecaea multimorphosa CBS 102226 TaxID=1442371 RepID=A0A0D2JLN8_9EURO|nr:uncharacterized protein Z520_09957 [Fonsecaea multimorphosa CBS 102226]KIX94247.1 hypothetical protein Z520_09957 [Fonsecaea multimorphosa CBS 102226]OAL19929.1 hypothetical protein AYO22_09456 [Fonsecaea multimorphosa]
MPLSRARSRPRIPLFRSLSASAAAPADLASHDNATIAQDETQPPRQRSSGGFSLPTLSTLAGFNFHRRPRTKSVGKRKSPVPVDDGPGSERASTTSAGTQIAHAPRLRPNKPKDLPLPLEPPNNKTVDTNTTPSATSPATVAPTTPTSATQLELEPEPSDPESTLATAAPASHSLSLSLHPDTTSSTTAGTRTSIPTTNTQPTTPSLGNPNTSIAAPPDPAPSPPTDPSCPVLRIQRPSTPTIPTLSSVQCDRHETLDAMQRKIWVKRPGASPTRVEVAEDDLVDNVRDVILQKYANSLGRSIDAPDITLKIISREHNNKNVSAERALGPEEPIGATLDAYYPGGQQVDEALIIEVASRRTPRASPRAGNHQISYYYTDQYRPDDAAREYFPPMPLHSPHLAHVPHPNSVGHSMAVLTTGQLPPLPSPGSHGQRRHARPKYGRQHTSSPTILHTVQPNGQVIESKAQLNAPASSAAPLPTPPPQGPNEHKPSITPPNRVSSPHPGQKLRRRKGPAFGRSVNGDPQVPPTSLPAAANLLDGTVPPINVLLVEDNVINLKLLEAFMKRLKVRWKSAMNGKEAVAMWRTGGFHLVLMDIQLPVMNGLEATKEIRRLEAVNGIGVFSGSPIETALKSPQANGSPVGEADVLSDRSLFKSPVIIVALTASSLQSDRHEALAAGCNDFLTKPVNFVWMERKVTEWGCMQALIDYDGWRKWKQFAEDKGNEDPAKQAADEKEEKAKAKAALKAMFSRPPPTIKKDKDSGANSGSNSTTTTASTASTAASGSERTSTPVQNGTPKKGSNPGQGSSTRGHKSNRSIASGGGGNLESMAEEDEKAA